MHIVGVEARRRSKLWLIIALSCETRMCTHIEQPLFNSKNLMGFRV